MHPVDLLLFLARDHQYITQSIVPAAGLF